MCLGTTRTTSLDTKSPPDKSMYTIHENLEITRQVRRKAYWKVGEALGEVVGQEAYDHSVALRESVSNFREWRGVAVYRACLSDAPHPRFFAFLAEIEAR